MAPCRLDNTNHLTYPLTDSHRPLGTATPPFLSTINHEAIAAVINNSPPKKALGSDGLQNWVWKLVWDKVKSHVAFFFRCITITGLIPQAWKTAVTVMIPKPGKPD